MSTFTVTIEEITSIHQHPNADRLEIAKILGTQTIVPKGEYRPGDRVAFFPPDSLLHPEAARTLGVAQYLKTAEYGPEFGYDKCKCRVAATRLRGIPSYGFVAKCDGEIGTDVSAKFGAYKYEPPAPKCLDRAPDHPAFHEYTSIEHFWKYPNLILRGEQVTITEKTHGTNSRIGLIATGELADPFVFMAGSHHVNLKPGNNLYWSPLEDEKILNLLTSVCDERHSVILFGEIYGKGVQDLDYGLTEPSFLAFDISVNGQYLDYDLFQAHCDYHGVPRVPPIYEGPFEPDMVEEWTHGPSLVGENSGKFKGREGIVIKPQRERYDLYGRVILKSVSADYLGRKGATDNA